MSESTVYRSDPWIGRANEYHGRFYRTTFETTKRNRRRGIVVRRWSYTYGPRVFIAILDDPGDSTFGWREIGFRRRFRTTTQARAWAARWLKSKTVGPMNTVTFVARSKPPMPPPPPVRPR